MYGNESTGAAHVTQSAGCGMMALFAFALGLTMKDMSSSGDEEVPVDERI